MQLNWPYTHYRKKLMKQQLLHQTLIIDKIKIKLNKKQNEIKHPSANQEAYDIGQDLGISVNNTSTEDLLKPRLPDKDYHTLINSLNTKQRNFFYHILHWSKLSNEPLYAFLTGGAGVGKSQVLKALYNALLRYYSTLPGNNPDDTYTYTYTHTS